GARSHRRIETWSEPDDRGIRWWAKVADHSPLGQRTTFELEIHPEARQIEGVKPRLAAEWPAEPTVAVPMRNTRDQLLLRVNVSGRDAWALLDSGAGITVIDATQPLVQAFTSRAQVAGSGAT